MAYQVTNKITGETKTTNKPDYKLKNVFRFMRDNNIIETTMDSLILTIKV